MIPSRRRGFTLVELTVVLALIAILFGLVIVRFSWAGPTQVVIAQARALGYLVRTYREKAQTEARLYALRLDLESGTYEILAPAERTSDALAARPCVRSGQLQLPMRFGPVQIAGAAAKSPVTLYFGRLGVVPPTSIAIEHANGPRVVLRLDPVLNEVSYDER